MVCYSLSHLADRVLVRELASLVTQDRATLAALLAHLAEVDARRLYAPAGCSSMFDYCVRELRMSEDVAFKRITAARVARNVPEVYAAVADGRLGMSAILMLAAHLTKDSAAELLGQASGKTNAELKLLLAERFPQPDMPTLVTPIGPPDTGSSTTELAVRRVAPAETLGLRTIAETPACPPKLAPLSPGRFAVQVTLDQQEYDDLRRAQDLLGHALPSGDAARVIGRALRALVRSLEKRKYATRCVAGRPDAAPRASRQRATASSRATIPAQVRRQVAARDGGRCTFVGEHGRRCEARRRLEFDHVIPVARGGAADANGLRLRCRAHNQLEAERVFGAGYMQARRDDARARRATLSSRAVAPSHALPATDDTPETIVPWLQALGFRRDEARRGAEAAAHLPDASLEARVRTALRSLSPKSARRVTTTAGDR